MYPEGQTVLVVDHDLARRQSIERILTEEGFSVTAVSGGFAAARAAKAKRFAVIITAVELPGTLDGTTTVRRLRARQPWVKALFTATVSPGPRWTNRDSHEFIAPPFHRRPLLCRVLSSPHPPVLPAPALL